MDSLSSFKPYLAYQPIFILICSHISFTKKIHHNGGRRKILNEVILHGIHNTFAPKQSVKLHAFRIEALKLLKQHQRAKDVLDLPEQHMNQAAADLCDTSKGAGTGISGLH